MNLSFLQNNSDAVDRTTYTFSGESLGAADTERYIIVGVVAKAGADRSLSSVSVGGVSATIIGTQKHTSFTFASIAIAKVPTGTTGDVVVTFSNTMQNCGIALYRALNLTSLAAIDSGGTTNANPLSVDVDVPANGFVIGISSNALVDAAATATWTNADRDFQGGIESFNMNYSSASKTFSSAQTDLSVSCNWSAVEGNRTALMVASWEGEAVETEVSDNLSLTESITFEVINPVTFSVEDTIGLTEDITFETINPVTFSVTDNIGLTEDIDIENINPVEFSVLDIIGLTENILVLVQTGEQLKNISKNSATLSNISKNSATLKNINKSSR